MGVTITSVPSNTSITGNQVLFTLNTDNYPLTAGLKTQVAYFLTSLPEEGDQMLLRWMDGNELKEAHFYFMDVPDDSGTTVDTPNGLTAAEYMEGVLAPAIAGHPLVSEYFNCLWDGFLVLLTALETGADYNLESVANGFEFNEAPQVEGVSFTAQPDYTMRYRIRLSGTNIFTDFYVGEWANTVPDLNGNATVDVGRLISDLMNELDPIDVMPAQAYVNLFTIKEYELEVTERWTVVKGKFREPTMRKVVRGNAYKAIKGREPVRLWSESNFYTDRGDEWLGLQGLERNMTYDSTARGHVLFISSPAAGNLVYTAEIYKTDGTTESVVIYDNYPVINAIDNLFTVKIGYLELGLDATVPVSDVVYYELTLTRAFAVTSPLRIYPEHGKRYHRELVYRGMYNLPENLMLVGEQTESSEVEAQQYESARPLPLTKDHHTTRKANHNGRDNLSVHTGALSKAQAAALWEVLHSNEVYILEGTEYVAVSVQNKDILRQKITRDGNNILGTPLLLSFNRE